VYTVSVATCVVQPIFLIWLTPHSVIRQHANSDVLSENFRQIHERVTDRLLDSSSEYEQIPLNFHLTSVYDHSLHEAFSRVLHKLIASLPYLEELLNVFCAVRYVSFTVRINFHLEI
jgi:Gtr1/RagA G protein conserved region